MLEEDSPYPAMYTARGKAYMDSGMYRLAIQDLERSLELVGDSTETRDTHRILAQAYTSLGQTEMAEKHRGLADR
jgi:Tfp pilus assembly protein PilF